MGVQYGFEGGEDLTCCQMRHRANVAGTLFLNEPPVFGAVEGSAGKMREHVRNALNAYERLL